MAAEGSTFRTVIVAVIANLGIAIAKIVAALLTGSASMWAEAAHSVADTGNEVLLFVGLRKSDRGPDKDRPFGYGQERYFWAFLAALGIFLVGGTLSIGEGIRSLLLPEPVESLWVGVGVLLVAAVFEAYSWQTARKQLKRDAAERQRSMREHLARASDPSATTVFLEDTAALIGLAVALAALLLHAWTGWATWDAIGSIAIGVLLIAVAFLLARRSKALLLEEAAPDDVVDPIRQRVASADWTGDPSDVHAVYVGPSSLLVNISVTPALRLQGEPAATLIAEVGRLRAELLADPAIAQVTVTLTSAEQASAVAVAGQGKPS
ncbi:cation diffusion facilitator family transporter [Actinoplanes tereljensis]|uniref:Cation diffusion facilitator transporter n=1 Tax=Paractinoplanes tereljensis TaxID=571912 RepID=A0A919NK91_9ACTN|nr:cation diffusion facilitator family transporter [Actinoplanes tereljensis]GIF20289.1 cation diffusion facilitator transporter [Actinoplanes tereljensis]